MSRGPTTVNRVWLAILRAGRPVKYADVAKALPELTHNQRAPALNVAYRLGYVERDGATLEYTYNVTPRCLVPPGVPLVEVLEATA